MRLAGFAPVGNPVTPPPVSDGDLDSGVDVSAEVTLHSDIYGQIQLPLTSYRAVATTDSSGAPTVNVAFEADALLSLCRGFSSFCESGGHPVRDAVFSFGEGSLIVSGEVYIDIFNSWQKLDMSLVPSTPDFFRIHSVMLNGVAWQVPDNAFGAQIQGLAAEVNDALRGLTLGYSGLRLRLRRLALDEAHLVAVFASD